MYTLYVEAAEKDDLKATVVSTENRLNRLNIHIVLFGWSLDQIQMDVIIACVNVPHTTIGSQIT